MWNEFEVCEWSERVLENAKIMIGNYIWKNVKDEKIFNFQFKQNYNHETKNTVYLPGSILYTHLDPFFEKKIKNKLILIPSSKIQYSWTLFFPRYSYFQSSWSISFVSALNYVGVYEKTNKKNVLNLELVSKNTIKRVPKRKRLSWWPIHTYLSQWIRKQDGFILSHY